MVEKIFDIYKQFKEQILYIVFGVLTTAINIVRFFCLHKGDRIRINLK